MGLEGSGAFRRGRDRDRDLGGAFQYSRRLTPCGRGLRQPPGLTALGCQGSVRDRLTPPGRVEGFRPRELYSIAALARYGALSGAIFYAAFGGENHTTGLRPKENMPSSLRSRQCIPPLVAGATTFPPRWEACHLILSRLRLPANQVPLPPLRGGTMGA